MGKSVKQLIVDRLFGAEIKSQVSAGILEYTRSQAAAIGSRPEDEGWRRLTGPNATREIVTTTQERMQEVAVYLAENNPMAKWIIDILADFLLADGLPFEAENEDISQALEEFWYDPLNQLDVYLRKHVREQRIYGELCLPVFTAQYTGTVRLGYIDPAQIDVVITDPENVKMAIGVVLKAAMGQLPRRLKIVLPPNAEDIMSGSGRVLRDTFSDGECFFSAINNLTNSPRGRSELLATADWIDAYEQFLFDCADRWPLLNSFIWDITVKGGDTSTCKAQAEALTKKAGSAYAHNENVTLQAVTPDLKTQEIDTGARVLRNHILGSHGYPEIWYGGGGDANRAASVEMGTPAFKMLASKQREYKAFWQLVFQTVIDRRRAAGTLSCSDDDAKNWSIVLPDLTAKDLTKNSAALQQVSASLAAAISQKIIDTESARKIFLFITAALGIELDEEDVKTRLDEELKKQAEQDYNTNPNPTLPSDQSPGGKVPWGPKGPSQGGDNQQARDQAMKETVVRSKSKTI